MSSDATKLTFEEISKLQERKVSGCGARLHCWFEWGGGTARHRSGTCDVQAELKSAHREYVARHPELRSILNDFVSAVLTEKPADVVEFARQHFALYRP